MGLAALMGFLTRNTELAFYMPWQLLAITATAVLVICSAAASLSMLKVFRLEPAIVFKS